MSNNPPVTVEFTKEEAEFLVRNCDSNITYALGALPQVEQKTAEKLIETMEMFKKINVKVKKAIEL